MALPARKTFFEKGYHAAGRRSILEWARVRNSSPRGLIFVPPLIGGDLSQQVRSFRSLIRREYDLVSFNYSGHGGSSGKFSLGATIWDTLHMLSHANRLSEQERLPLFGIASCYSAIPILYAIHCLAEPLRRLVLINAIPDLSPKAVVMSFLTYYRRIFPHQKSPQRVMTVVGNYVNFLFPGVVKDRDYFGALDRRRTKLFKTVSEFLALNPLEGVRLKTTPVLCLYARKDRVLEIYDAGVKTDYENDIRQICPQALFHALDGDHFLSLPMARGEALSSIISFLQEFMNRTTKVVTCSV
jgi:pimeloyl-ACP methyl ester carboxylesterase